MHGKRCASRLDAGRVVIPGSSFAASNCQNNAYNRANKQNASSNDGNVENHFWQAEDCFGDNRRCCRSGSRWFDCLYLFGSRSHRCCCRSFSCWYGNALESQMRLKHLACYYLFEFWPINLFADITFWTGIISVVALFWAFTTNHKPSKVFITVTAIRAWKIHAYFLIMFNENSKNLTNRISTRVC